MTGIATSAIDTERLRTWMDRQGLGDGPIDQLRPIAGGTQNILVSFRRGDRSYVLRRPPLIPQPGSDETMRREVRILRALGGTDVPCPGLIAACDDTDVLGVAFYLMEPVEGFNAVNGLPALHASSPDIRRRMGFALIDGAAALGRVDYRAVGLEGFGRPENYLGRQVSRWSDQLAGYAKYRGWPGPSGIQGVAQVAGWLQANQPPMAAPGILHGDYQFANVMYRNEGPELAAIVDWELATVGDPLVDLGWVLATWRGGPGPDLPVLQVEPWSGFPDEAELIERYAARSTRDLTHIGWYVVLACYRLGIILEGTFARACAGEAPKASGELLHQTTVALFERAMARIDAGANAPAARTRQVS